MTETDEREGLVKTFWYDVRTRVANIEPKFAQLVDELSPDEKFPLYLAYYPYGAITADTESSFFPNQTGELYRLTDDHAPKNILSDLGYSISTAPLGMVLEKQLEVFIDRESERLTVPWLIHKPGMFFPFATMLNIKHHRTYAPNGLLSSAAGARSVFMLPHIGCSTHHAYLKRDYNIKHSTPKTLYEHWDVFRELAQKIPQQNPWRCAVLYFSENWVEHLHNDHAWIKLKQYLHEAAWKRYEYDRNRIYYDITFAMLQKKRNLKPSPYLVDTAKHLFATAVGASPGYIPLLDEQALPLDLIQKAYVDSYDLKKHYPTIIGPTHFIFESDELPIYYSLQNASTHIFSPKSRNLTSNLYELRELENIVRVYQQELCKKNVPCEDTVMAEIAKNVEFNFYHYKPDRHRVIKMTHEIASADQRFATVSENVNLSNTIFPNEAPFLRACASISRKPSSC